MGINYYTFFYKQLACLGLCLKFGQKISNLLATAHPEIGKFLTFPIAIAEFSKMVQIYIVEISNF